MSSCKNDKRRNKSKFKNHIKIIKEARFVTSDVVRFINSKIKMGDISKDIQSSFKNNKVKAIINLKYTANWLNSRENDFFKSYGISAQQYNILRILRGAKKAIKVQEVKERMIEKSPNSTRLMDKLYKKRFIERFRSEADGRVVYIDILKEGLDLLLRIDENNDLNFLENLNESEALQLSDLLDKIR